MLGFFSHLLERYLNKKTILEEYPLWTLKIGLPKKEGTMPKANIAPEIWPSQKETSISNHPFSGAMLVSGRVVFQPSISSEAMSMLVFDILREVKVGHLFVGG